MKRFSIVLLTLVVMLGSMVVLRADESYGGRLEVGLRAGGLFTEGNSLIDEDGIYGGQIGFNVSQKLTIEAAVLAGRTQVQLPSSDGGAMNTKSPAAKMDILLPSLELQVNLGSGRFRPYVAAGVADIHMNPTSNNSQYGLSTNKSDDLGVQYGIGARWLLTRNFMARMDFRHLVNTEHSYQVAGISKNNGEATAGLSWLFGGEEKAAAPVVAAVVDNDKDGVPDNVDKCLGTPAGTKVDANGCTLVVDTDGDGVADDQDKCAGTPSGTKVDARGCPVVVDSDGDGVTDDKDECPGTSAGTKVTASGCPETVKEIKDVGVLKGVMFETGSDKLSGNSHAVLDETAEILKVRSKVRVEIQGHTDNTGNAAANQKLSEDRALSVKKYLVSKGVSESQLETKGYGSTMPVADNKTADGRAQNRRIAFKVLSR